MASRETLVLELGMVAYPEALAMQRHFVARRAGGCVPDLLLLCQHPPVFTLGRSSQPEHVLPEATASGIPIVAVERGGDVTYHGPGQAVAYPILYLDGEERDLHRYLRRLEDTVLRTLCSFGIEGERIAGLTGVWFGGEKLCAIGVAVRRWVTFHGLALNVDMDLAPFEWVVPCGLHGRGVTSMARVLGRSVEVDAVQEQVVRHFAAVFGRETRVVDSEEVAREEAVSQ